MVKHKNILDFDSNRRSTPVENTVPVPQLVASVQHTAKHYLKELLPKFFSQIDDSLFHLPEKNNSYSEDITISSKDDDEMLFSIYAERINEMALGTWIEFIDPNTKSHSRGKLAWKCDFTKEFTFMDKKNKVVADWSYRQLVEKFELEYASVVEDIPLFDRALDSVIVGIKQALDIKNLAGNNSNH